MIDSVNDRRLATAGDEYEAQRVTRAAVTGETCLFCDRVFEGGEPIDPMLGACIPCMEKLMAEFGHNEEQS